MANVEEIKATVGQDKTLSCLPHFVGTLPQRGK
jgi:hypothetical protein